MVSDVVGKVAEVRARLIRPVLRRKGVPQAINPRLEARPPVRHREVAGVALRDLQ